MSSTKAKAVFLVGMPGSGKTSAGRALAERLGAPFLDTDLLVERMAGRPIPEIFASKGEAYFRALERRALALAAGARNVVVATGGGAPMDPRNLSLMRRSGTVVYLRATPETLWSRLHDDATVRPLLAGANGFAKLGELFQARQGAYAGADVAVDTEGRTLEEVAGALESEVAESKPALRPDLPLLPAPPRPTPLPAPLPAPSLRIKAGASAYGYYDFPGALSRTGELLAAVKAPPRRVLCVSTPLVWGLLGERVARSLEGAGYKVHTSLVPDGEPAKSRNHLGRLYEAGLEAGLSRSDVVLALGGGAVGDLAGYFAATFLRGLTFGQAPTTVLAQADSSVGGKVAVNLRAGGRMYKNMAGSFHQPALVIADPLALRHLPARQVRNGMAEVIKSAVIGDPGCFADFLTSGAAPTPRRTQEVGADLARVIRAAVAVKAAVVEADERDEGPRQVLNLGHTLGHAVEAVYPERFLHGEAVAIGMVAAARLSVRLGHLAEETAEQIRQVLAGVGLPTQLPSGADGEALAEAMTKDKKRDSTGIRLILPFAIGDCRLVSGVRAEELVGAALKSGRRRASEGQDA